MRYLFVFILFIATLCGTQAHGQTISLQSCPEADSLLLLSKRYEKRASIIMLGTVGLGIAGTATCSFSEAHTVGYICIGASVTSFVFVLYNTIKGINAHKKAIEMSENCRLSFTSEPDRVGLILSF